MRIGPMESNLLNSASDFLYDTHFYFNILSLAAIISARWLHFHKHGTCYSIVSCSPLILIGAHFYLSKSINYTTYLFSKTWWKNDCVHRSMLSRIRTLYIVIVVQSTCLERTIFSNFTDFFITELKSPNVLYNVHVTCALCNCKCNC